MPPKVKKDKAPKAEKVEEVLEKTEWDDMSVVQLEEAVKVLTEQVSDCKTKRNFYIQERDMVQQYYDISMQDVVETEAKIRNTESEKERMQDQHRNDIRIYVQKVKHLEHEHKNNLSSVASEGSKMRESESLIHEERKTQLRTKKTTLKVDLMRQEDSNQDEIFGLKDVMGKELVTLRHDFDRSLLELQGKYEARLTDLKDDLELRRKMEIHEIEERKNLHINKLISNHEKAFQEIKEYYYEITKDNLDLIKSVNDEYASLKAQESRTAKKMSEIGADNKTLLKKLDEAKPDVEVLRHKLQHYEKDKLSLQHVKARLLVLDEQHSALQLEHETLLQRFGQVEHERDAMHGTFEEVILTVQQRNSKRHEVLQRRLGDVQDKIERKNAQFSEVLSAANLDEVVLQNVTEKLDTVLTSKNQQIKQLKLDIARVKKAHDDLIRVYEARLVDLGIPETERNLMTPSTGLTSAPAGLV